MFEDNISILHLTGEEENILQAEGDSVKIPRTGIFICTEGWANVTIDTQNYHVTQDGMIIYFANTSLQITSRSPIIKGILLGADLETIQPLLYQITNFNALFVIKQNPMVMLTPERTNRLLTYSQLIEDLIMRIKQIAPSVKSISTPIPTKEILMQQSHFVAQSLMLEIIACYTSYGDIIHCTDNRKEDVLKKFMESLYRNFKTYHEVNFYAKEQCLTCRYFSAIIKERSGQTPGTWIATALLVEAKQLLRSSNMTIRDISDYLNFPNQSYFGKWFKNHTGLSPLEFKNGKSPKQTKEAELAKCLPNYIFNTEQI
ncbi:MAG: AraC family transcriptional regulator [Bacteroidaceae bacterium]|nr:AraC family transcriptional regulator [Bacteroidaceae bacterium]